MGLNGILLFSHVPQSVFFAVWGNQPVHSFQRAALQPVNVVGKCLPCDLEFLLRNMPCGSRHKQAQNELLRSYYVPHTELGTEIFL